MYANMMTLKHNHSYIKLLLLVTLRHLFNHA